MIRPAGEASNAGAIQRSFQKRSDSVVTGGVRIHGCSQLLVIHSIDIRLGLDKEFHHLQMPIPGGSVQRGHASLVQIGNVRPIGFEQQFCHSQLPFLSSHVQPNAVLLSG